MADYYSQHLPRLEEDRVNFQRVWDEVQPAFFETSRTVFEGYELKPDNYTAFVSIFNCGQRFLDSKSFQTYQTHPAGIIHQNILIKLVLTIRGYCQKYLTTLFSNKTSLPVLNRKRNF